MAPSCKEELEGGPLEMGKVSERAVLVLEGMVGCGATIPFSPREGLQGCKVSRLQCCNSSNMQPPEAVRQNSCWLLAAGCGRGLFPCSHADIQICRHAKRVLGSSCLSEVEVLSLCAY